MKISIEDLANEKVFGTNANILCNTSEDCDHEGEYIRCHLHSYFNCPYYIPNQLTDEQINPYGDYDG